MLKEDIWNTRFPSSELSFAGLDMYSVLKVAVFVVLFTKAWTQPSRNPLNSNLAAMGLELTEIPEGSPHTKSLNLAYNHISALGEYTFANNSYRSLTKIELNHNRISTMDRVAFKGLKQLVFVDLSDNNITSLDPDLFKYNTKLTKLDLSRNQIAFHRKQVLLLSQSIETLILSENKIVQIYEMSFLGLTNLKNLILDNNDISTIAPNSFRRVKSLHYLSLANTFLVQLNSDMFGTTNASELPRIVNLEGTPLANNFVPALRKVTNQQSLSRLIDLFDHSQIP